jgi:hypothetical protein
MPVFFPAHYLSLWLQATFDKMLMFHCHAAREDFGIQEGVEA